MVVRRHSPRLAQAALRIVDAEAAAVVNTEVPTKITTDMAPPVIDKESEEQRNPSLASQETDQHNKVEEVSSDSVEAPMADTIVEKVKRAPDSSVGDTEETTEETTEGTTEGTTEEATEEATEENGNDAEPMSSTQPAAATKKENSDMVVDTTHPVEGLTAVQSDPAVGATKPVSDLDGDVSMADVAEPASVEADSEPMQELAQLANDMESTARGTPRQIASPPAPVPQPSSTRGGRVSRSTTSQFFSSMEEEKRRLEADRDLAVQLAKEEDEALGLLSVSSAISGSESECYESQHTCATLESDDADDDEKPPPRKARKVTAKQSASTRSVSTEQPPKMKKQASKSRVGSRSVRNKQLPKEKETQKRGRQYSPTGIGSAATANAAASAESASDGERIPQDVLGYMSEGEIKGKGAFAEGLPKDFVSWLDMDQRLQQFQDETYQLFKKRTSTSAFQFNKSAKTYTLPPEFEKYAQTWVCTHGMKTQKKKKPTPKSRPKKTPNESETAKKERKSRKRRYVRYTGCTATLNATVYPLFESAQKAADFRVKWSATGGHNHVLSAQLYRYYPENRLRRTPELYDDVRRALSMGGTAQGMLHTLRAESGKPILIRDMHNLIARVKQMRVAGTTVEERLTTNLSEFSGTARGNCSSVFVNPETKQAQSVTFQSARMRRLFAAFPEVVLVDCTHSTNKNQFVLFSFVIHDIFGKGQYVNHSLMYRETIDNMTDAVIAFKKRNERWCDIRAFVVDKDFKERTVLKLHFPLARILLCHYHVIKYLAKKESTIKELVRATKKEKDDLIHVCRALVYAKSATVYNALVLLLAKKLGASMAEGDDELDVNEVLEEQDVFSEDPSESEPEDEDDLEDDEVVAGIQAAAVREAKEDDAVKRGKNHSFFRYFVKNWESCKEEWVSFHRQNVPHLGNNTNNRIEAKWGQMKRVVRSKMDMEEAVRTIQAMQAVSEDEYLVELKQPGTRVVHDHDPELIQLLHHVSGHAYELVKPEYLIVKDKTINYAVKERDGNAILTRTDDGDASEHTIIVKSFKCSCFFSQVRLLPCRHVFFYRTYKDFESVIPLKFINLRWSLLNPANDISVGDPAVPLKGRYSVKNASEAPNRSLNQGDRFCKAMAVLKPLAAAMSTQSPSTYDKMFAFIHSIESIIKRGDVPVLARKQDEDQESSEQEREETQETQDKEEQQQWREENKEESESDPDPDERVDTSFVLPSHTTFKSARRDLRESDAKQRLQAVMKEADKFMLTTGRKRENLSLADVEAVIESVSYSYFDAIPVMCGVPIIGTNTKSMLVQRRDEHVIADSATVRYILEEAVVLRLCADLEKDGDDSDSDKRGDQVVSVGDGKGFLSIKQLKTMRAFMDALAAVNAVVIATEWVYRKENTSAAVEFPFDSFGSQMSEKYAKDTVESLHYLPLTRVAHQLDTARGCDVLEISSNNWLHTTSVLAILTCLARIKPGIGVIKPEFVNMKDVDQRRRMITSNYAFSASTDCIIAILNIEGNHWCAFFIDKTKNVCTMYDPMVSGREGRVKTLKKLIKTDVQPLLSDRLTYRTFTNISQDDGDSCGVYAAVFLELFIHNAYHADTFPTSTTMFRMRYMRLVAGMLRAQDTAVSI